ncbi:MAG: LysR family transcriptional regulator [Arenicella sp.]
MNIDTKWLQDFLILSKTHSFSRSAEQRYVSQATFSRRIQSLEYAVGKTLVDRTTSPVTLTKNGIEFCEIVENVIAQLESFKQHHMNYSARPNHFNDAGLTAS